MPDFVIPSESLSPPSPISFGEETQSLDTLERARDLNTPIVNDVFKGATQLASFLFGQGEKAAHAEMQKKVLEAGDTLDKLASDLVQKKQWSFGADSPPSDPHAFPGDIGGLATVPSKSIYLDPSFADTIKKVQTDITDNYKDFPAVQDEAMTLLRPMVENAYRTAYDEAGKQIKEQGKSSVIDLAERASKLAVQTGNDSALNDVFANKDNQSYFTADEWDTLKRRETANADKGIAYSAGISALKSNGLQAGMDAATVEAGNRDLSPADIVTTAERVRSVANQAVAGYTQLAAKTEAEAMKDGMPLETAADKLDAQVSQDGYPSLMKPITDQMRVDGQMEPVRALIQQGQEAAASNMRNSIATEKGWTQEQYKWSQTVMDTYAKDFAIRDGGTANEFTTFYDDVLSRVPQGTFEGGALGAIRTAQMMMLNAQDEHRWGTESAKAYRSVLDGLLSWQAGHGNLSAAVVDKPTLIRDMDAIIGQPLSSEDIAKWTRIINSDYTGNKISQTQWHTMTSLLKQFPTQVASKVGAELRPLFVDSKTGAFDAEGYANAMSSLVTQVIQVGTKDPIEIGKIGDSVAEFEKAQKSRDVVGALDPTAATPKQSSFQQFFGIVPTDVKAMGDVMGLVSNGTLQELAHPTKTGVTADPDALKVESKLKDIALSDWMKSAGVTNISPDNVKMQVKDPKTGTTYLLAIKDPRPGKPGQKPSVWVPAWENNILKWKDISK